MTRVSMEASVGRILERDGVTAVAADGEDGKIYYHPRTRNRSSQNACLSIATRNLALSLHSLLAFLTRAAGQVLKRDFETPLSSDGVGRKGMVLRGSFVIFVVNGNETTHRWLQDRGDLITRAVHKGTKRGTKTIGCVCGCCPKRSWRAA